MLRAFARLQQHTFKVTPEGRQGQCHVSASASCVEISTRLSKFQKIQVTNLMQVASSRQEGNHLGKQATSRDFQGDASTLTQGLQRFTKLRSQTDVCSWFNTERDLGSRAEEPLDWPLQQDLSHQPRPRPHPLQQLSSFTSPSQSIELGKSSRPLEGAAERPRGQLRVQGRPQKASWKTNVAKTHTQKCFLFNQQNVLRVHSLNRDAVGGCKSTLIKHHEASSAEARGVTAHSLRDVTIAGT